MSCFSRVIVEKQHGVRPLSVGQPRTPCYFPTMCVPKRDIPGHTFFTKRIPKRPQITISLLSSRPHRFWEATKALMSCSLVPSSPLRKRSRRRWCESVTPATFVNFFFLSKSTPRLSCFIHLLHPLVPIDE